MTAGFPEGTPLRRASNFTYNHFFPVQFLRTTYKAGPLVALGRRARWPGCAAPRRGEPSSSWRWRWSPAGRSSAGAALDDQLLWKRIPPPGPQAADHVDATRRATAARSSCPASSTPTTTGAGRSTRSCPMLADKPVATRNAVGYADLRATDLLWTRRRARPAAPRAPGPARPAAGPDGRAHGGRRRRRRPHPQRRRPRRRGRRRARPARAARPPRGATREPPARRGNARRSRGALPAGPRLGPPVGAGPASASSRPQPQWSSTAPPRASRLAASARGAAIAADAAAGRTTRDAERLVAPRDAESAPRAATRS